MKFVGTKWECADDLDSVLASISTETIISPLGTWEAKTLPDPISYLEVYLNSCLESRKKEFHRFCEPVIRDVVTRFVQETLLGLSEFVQR